MFVCAISTNINFDLFTFQINTNATALTEAEEERPLCFSICLCLISFNFDLFTFQIRTSAAALQAWQQNIITGPWMLEKKLDQKKPGSLRGSFLDILINPTDGNVVVLATNEIQVFSNVGEYRFRINVPPRDLCKQIAVSADGNTYFMTKNNEFVQMYDNNCKFKCQWVSSCPNKAPFLESCLLGLAINNEGQVLVGDVISHHINVHKQDGSYITSIKVSIAPWYLAVTSQDTIVVAKYQESPQIVSNTGQVLHILKHPKDDAQWGCFGAYCYRDTIFITNLYKSKAWELLCYTESGQYQGCLPIPDARCCAMIENGTKIVVGQYTGCAIYSLKRWWPRCNSQM